MLLVAAKVWVESMNAILESVIEIWIDVAVVSRRNGETLIDDFCDWPSLALIRTALFRCSVVLDTWVPLVAPTGRQSYTRVIACRLVSTKVQADEAWCVCAVSRRPQNHVNS
jgi:hypothetical protein